TFSILTDASDYPGASNLGGNPAVFRQYCNGSRVPPEFGGSGYNVPPGISDATVPNPIFNLTPTATGDEGNNWINISWGPLALSNPSSGGTLGNYAIPVSSPAANSGTLLASPGLAPTTDYFGNSRVGRPDIGAVEPTPGTNRSATTAPAALAFGSWATGTTSTPQTVTVTNTGSVALGGGTFTVTAPFSRPAGAAGGTCGAALAVAASCTVNVLFSPTATTSSNGTLTVAYAAGTSVTGSPVPLTGTGVSMAVTPAPLSFSQAHGTPSAAQTLTVRNSPGGTVNLSATSAAGTGFSRPAGAAGGTCGASLGNGASCTINVVFSAP